MPEAPKFADLYQTGRKLLKAGQLREALATLEEARQLNDLDSDVHDALATTHFLLGVFESAAKHFERVTRLDPRRAGAWTNLGAVYNRLGNYQKSVEVLRRAVQIDRKSSASFYNLGIAYKHLKQWHMAVPAYREALRIDPKMADAYLNLGNVYCEMKNYSQAVTQFRKALELKPGFERAKHGLETAEAQMALSRQAINPFGRLVSADQLAHQDSAEQGGAESTRELSDPERIADRKAIHELAGRLKANLAEILEVLEVVLEPAVKTLNKMLTQPLSPHGVSITKAEAHENFAAARARYLHCFDQFDETLKELREHESEAQVS